MSERELFPTDHLEYVSLRVVTSKNITVLTFDEYEALNNIEENMFFWR